MPHPSRSCYQSINSASTPEFRVNPKDGLKGGLKRITSKLDRQYKELREAFVQEDVPLRRMENRVRNWVESHIGLLQSPISPPTIFPIHCTLNKNAEQLERVLTQNSCVLLCSQTGAGKSISAPFIGFRVANKALREGWASDSFAGLGFRGLHLVPTAEQAHQNASYIKGPFLDSTGILIGSYSGAFSSMAKEMNDIEDGKTNYLYCTHFYGIHALSGDTRFHVVVIDEVHQLTPNVLSLLRMVKRKISNGEIFRVMLLSATMSERMKDELSYYFSFDIHRVGIVTAGTSPYHRIVLSAGDGHLSREALKQVHGSCYDQTLFETEGGDGAPNNDVMRSRAVVLASMAVAPNMRLPHNRIPLNAGVLVFLPGSPDVLISHTLVNTEIRSHGSLKGIAVLKVTDQERSDLEVLKQKNDDGTIRVVLSTPRLATGTTPIGVNKIIDSGLCKVPTPHNRHGVDSLQLRWQDANSRMQRRGRIGRDAPGTVYEAFSPQRARIMEREDYTLDYLDAKYINADLVSILNNDEKMMLEMDVKLYNELMLETGILGFLRGRGPSRPPIIDPVGVAISRAFNELPLDLGNFLLMCDAYHCLLSGVVFVASAQCKHKGTNRPSSAEGKPGRNSDDLAINSWPEWAKSADESDLMVYTEIILNLVADRYRHRLAGEKEFVSLPPFTGIATDGFPEVYIAVRSLSNGLKALGLIKSFSDLFSYEKSGLKLNERGSFRVIQLEHPHVFSTAIVTAFGFRLLTQADWNDSKWLMKNSYIRTPFKINGEYRSRSGSVQLVLGERAKPTRPNCLAVYYDLFQHAKDEGFIVGLFHQCSIAEFLLCGNAYGSRNDEINEADNTLIIHTCNGSVRFHFQEDREILKLVAKFRQYQRMIPVASLLGNWESWTSFKEGIYEFVKRDLSKSMVTERIAAIRTINSWKDCYI